MHKVGYIDCVQAKGLALYSTHLVNCSDHTSHPDESLATESVFSWPITGCKSKAREFTDLLLSAAGLIVIRMLKFVSGGLAAGGLLTFTYFRHFWSPVQSSPLQSSN